MLVLKTTSAQGAALETLLAQQQDRSSPNYHKWLTPQEFGEQFGASESDIQKITSWLQSQGFQIDNVANGRNVIQFSGNAAQVQVRVSHRNSQIHDQFAGSLGELERPVHPRSPDACCDWRSFAQQFSQEGRASLGRHVHSATWPPES